MTKRSFFQCCFFIAIICAFSFHHYKKSLIVNTVNICGWHGIISPDILKDFEKETGIKVVHDFFDNNDVLEAKLLATNIGYDIVFPSFIPYASRQCAMGLYSKLDRKLIPNLKNIETSPITKVFTKAGGNTNYIIPYYWGTTGIIYNGSIVSKLFPGEIIDSYEIILRPNRLKKLAQYGVCFPEEYIDIFLGAGLFWKIPNESRSVKNLELYMEKFKEIRKYIRKFNSSMVENDFITGEICIAITHSDDAWRTQHLAKSVGQNIKYIIPKEGGILWVDCIGIPDKAPHQENAHKFVNFLLRPDIAARITNNSGLLTNVLGAIKSYDAKITENRNICPPSNEIDKLLIGERVSVTIENLEYSRLATRIWSNIKVLRKNG